MKKQFFKQPLMLQEGLGQALSSKAIAEYIGLDEATVRKYYQSLGGIRIGTKYLFFEKEVLNAIQKRTHMDWSDTEGWPEDREAVRDEEGGPALGGEAAKKNHHRLEDPFGIFPGTMGK
jgi:hypothetical protein